MCELCWFAVRSFGTEDRPTERPIPAKEDVFEYIIFRGSDIKVIDVVEPPKQASNSAMAGAPSDPAIIDFSVSCGWSRVCWAELIGVIL